MILIKKSETADTRTAKEPVSKETLLLGSIQHINDVQKALHWMAQELMRIAEKHDHTKIENIDEFFVDFRAIQEGRFDDFKSQHWFQNIHLTERHHFTDRCPDDVTLFDVLERICDIVMAGMARSGEVYRDKLPPVEFGKYAGTKLKDVPSDYLEWFTSPGSKKSPAWHQFDAELMRRKIWA